MLTDTNFKHEVLEYHKPALVEFAADWCGLCHIIDPIINRLASEFPGQIKFCKIDYDLNPAIMNTYGIRDLPTILFFNEGQIVDHIIGPVSQRDLSDRLENLLQIAITNAKPISQALLAKMCFQKSQPYKFYSQPTREVSNGKGKVFP